MSAVTPFDWWTRFRGTAADGRRLKVLYDYDGATDGKPRYVGMARAGTAETAERWFITRFTYNGDRCITAWETSNDNVKWSDRTTITYDLPDPN